MTINCLSKMTHALIVNKTLGPKDKQYCLINLLRETLAESFQILYLFCQFFRLCLHMKNIWLMLRSSLVQMKMSKYKQTRRFFLRKSSLKYVFISTQLYKKITAMPCHAMPFIIIIIIFINIISEGESK